MAQKKAPLTLKDFMVSSLIINYPCNHTSSKTAPKLIDSEAIMELCAKMEKASAKCGNIHPKQMPNKTRD